MSLLGPNGKPISSRQFAKDRAKSPLIGEMSAPWAGHGRAPARFPLENSLQFDTSRLTLNDYRIMRDHYQVNSSLTVLTFMLHQLEWKIECDSIKVAKHVEDNLGAIWTRLVRALSQAFVFGFSPNVLQWENDPGSGKMILSKIKDMTPESSRVNWKEVSGVSQRDPNTPVPKVKVYDGIKVAGYPDIPKENTLWYPLLMEEGDYYGKKLLKAAFQPWFFSSLIHFYSNRYFERFGEPVIVSRAPYDDKIDVNGAEIQGNVLMAGLNEMVRNGASVTLPNTKAMNGLDGVANYEYTMEYLESQMRGADFERYLTRLDQEISLALFTPLLMMNTADGGSFNLGVVHTQMYLGMLNAVAGDWKEYIDRYVLAPMAIHNFGPNAKLPKIKFRKLGATKDETVRTILAALLRDGNGDTGVKVDLEELGQEVGLTLEEIELVTEREAAAAPAAPSPSDPVPAPPAPGKAKARTDTRVGRPEREQRGKGTEKKGVALSMAHRVSGQFIKQIRDNVPVTEFSVDLGYRRKAAEVMDATELRHFERLAAETLGVYYGIQTASAEPLESEIRSAVEGIISASMEEVEYV